MGEVTGIEWCHHTFNPWRGCQAVSPACDGCYAKAVVEGRLRGDFAQRTPAAERAWRQPLTWHRKAEAAGERRRVFAPSLGDPWDNAVPAPLLARFLDLIAATPALDWLLLTKRPQLILRRLAAAASWTAPALGGAMIFNWLDGRPPAHVWLGTTVENQEWADRRIPELLRVPARLRFLSCEPLLGPVDLAPWWKESPPGSTYWHPNGLHWVIAGGETGPQARPPHPDWLRTLRDQCAAAEVPFFFKQWGTWAPTTLFCPHVLVRHADGAFGDLGTVTGVNLACMASMGRRRAGALLDDREHREVPAC